MKNSLIIIVVIVIGMVSTSTWAQKSENMDQLSYSLGVLIAQNFKQQGLEEVQSSDVANGISDVLAGDAKMTVDEANAIFGDHMQKLQMEKHSGNVEAGKKFLEENGKRDGVITLASGLQYEVITEGSGPKPAATDKVTTHYHGTLIDGTVFDSSVDRGQPASFPVNGVIPAWVEALQLMSPGSKWKLYCPSDLAYGERGAGQQIGPFATLIFEVELISID
jgi:FKBP-type peptidyl-prolyl cis-trans isomerase FklB